MKRLFTLSSIALVACLFLSCGKTCRCYKYDGSIDEYDVDDLKKQERTCSDLEKEDMGLTYSLCERVS